jgi:hypothetical protein
LLVNSDRFLIVSGQRNYFYSQKQFYLNEIDRLNELYQKVYFKKRDYKKKMQESQTEMKRSIELLEKELKNLRNKV